MRSAPQRPALVLAAGALAVLLASAGCVYGATEVLVVLDTDVPSSRVMTLTVTVRAPGSRNGQVRRWLRGDGVDGGIRMPGASFAIIPRPGGPLDEAVTLVVDANVAPGALGEPALSIQRTVRFAFVPRREIVVRVFVAAVCGARATGCSTVPPDQCTNARLCDERGLTCGATGRCEDINVTPTPMDAGSDIVDIRDITDIEDAPSCASGRTRCSGTCVDLSGDVANCGACGVRCSGTQVCAMGVCGTSCAAGATNCSGACVNTANDPAHCGACANVCAAGVPCVGGACTPCGGDGAPCCGGSCSGSLSCVGGTCQCVPDCTGRNCGGDPNCGQSCGNCTASQTCQSGQCVCVPTCGTRQCGANGCGGSCGSCASNEYCDGSGRCRCGPDCAGRECGPDGCGGSCGSCGRGFACDAAGQCVCGATSDWRLVGGACLPSCGAVLTWSGYNDVSTGCCPTPCTGREAPEASWGCSFCCESFSGVPACQ